MTKEKIQVLLSSDAKELEITNRLKLENKDLKHCY
jgi:hypothetical protein